jgi:DNA-binding NarL/FixJ family response regulator
MEQCTRVLIADDRPRSRDGLKALLFTWPEVEVVGEAADGREAVGLVEDRHPDVVLMDSRMPVMDGLVHQRQLARGQGHRVDHVRLSSDRRPGRRGRRFPGQRMSGRGTVGSDLRPLKGLAT